MSHRAEAWLTGTIAGGCAYLATGSAQAGHWLSLGVFAVLALLLARISYREQLLARRSRDEAVRAEALARPPGDKCGPECTEQHTYAHRCALKPPPISPWKILGAWASDDTPKERT